MSPLELTQLEISEWSPLTQAVGKLMDAHFAVFNAACAERGKRRRAQLYKAMGTLYRAAAHIRNLA